MALTNASQLLESTTCALPDCEPIPHLVDEVTGHIFENEDDDKYYIVQCEQEDDCRSTHHTFLHASQPVIKPRQAT